MIYADCHPHAPPSTFPARAEVNLGPNLRGRDDQKPEDSEPVQLKEQPAPSESQRKVDRREDALTRRAREHGRGQELDPELSCPEAAAAASV